ncbi:MAG: hypothetical protein AAGA86_03550 [Bacteroidota bacterium]
MGYTTKCIQGIVILYITMLLGCSSDSDNEGIPENLENPGNTFRGEVAWIRNFGGSGEDTPRSVIQTVDGGFAVLGFTNSTDGDLADKSLGVNDYWLIKLDADGRMQWNKTYGGSKDDRGQSVIQTVDGGYAITGYAMSSDGDGSQNEGFHDNWILKLDASGDIIWERSFGFSGHDHSYDLVQASDGGFFFIGFLDITAARTDGFSEKGLSPSPTAHGVGEFWGTKIDASGNLEWRRYFGGTNNDRAHAVVQSNDGGFVMAGFSESDDFDISNTKGSYDFWVLKVSGQGELLWERSYGGTGIEIAQDIAQTDDGNYVITGHTFSTDTDVTENHGESDMWLIKISDTGELIWQRTFGGSGFDAAESVRLASDGGFVLSGNSKSSDQDATENGGENDIWVLKTNAEGQLQWQKSLGGAGLDFGFDAMEVGETEVLFVGESGISGISGIVPKGQSDLVVVKLE